MYWWEGKIATDSEILLMMKTRTSLIPGSQALSLPSLLEAISPQKFVRPELTETVKKAHSYTVPEGTWLGQMELLRFSVSPRN